MRYCPTCGYEVSQSQRFCPECSTKLTGASAPTSEPPADVSNAVPHRPGGGWALQDDANDDLDDFFSSYRRKSEGASTPTTSGDEALPTRRSRRRFNPDLTYDSTPLPAAPQPDAPRPAVPGPAAAEQRPFVADARDEQARLGDDAAESRPERPAAPAAPAADRMAPKPAAAATNETDAHWFERLDQDEPAAPVPAPQPQRPAAAPPVPPQRPAPAQAQAQAPQAPVPQPSQPQPPAAPPHGQQPGAPERPFDDVLVGREPGDETMDHPIIARDFERTGIVHVPRLDDGRPVAPSQPPADVDAPWQAPQTGLNPAVAPLPEQGGWPAAGAPSPFDGDGGTGLGALVRDPRRPDGATDERPGAAFGPAATSQFPVAGGTAQAQPQQESPAAPGQDGPGETPDAARSIFAEWFGETNAPGGQRGDRSAGAGAAAAAGAGAASAARAAEASSPAPSSTDDEWADVLFRADDDEPRREAARPPAEPAVVDPAVEQRRPWYEQGLDGTEETGQEPPFWATSRPAAPVDRGVPPGSGGPAAAAPTSAPTYGGPRAASGPVAPAGPGRAGAGADVIGSASGAAAGAGGAGAPSGPFGPGGGGGGPRGSGGGLDRTGKRRLVTIGIAFVGAILLIVSAFIIGGVINARDDDQAAPGDTAGETDPAQTEGQGDPTPDDTPAVPPAVADPNFEAVAFESESGNLRCVISPEYGVACQHSGPAFEVPAEVCAETGTSGAIVGLDSNGVTYPCLTEDIPYGQETLPMGEPITAGEFTCIITWETGVNCFNASDDIFGLEFELGISTSGRISETPREPVNLPDVAY